MTSRPHCRMTLMFAAVALACCGSALAQSATGTAAPAAVTITAPQQGAASTAAAPSVTVPASPAPPPVISTLTRLDTANTAFEKLAPDRAFLSRSDLAQLPNFGNAFAKADRDHDGRLDRTEFTDAWNLYLEQAAPAGPLIAAQ